MHPKLKALKISVDEIIKEDLPWYFRHYIRSPIRQFKHGIKNLITYRSVIWYDRWFDYGYITDLMELKIRLMKENWKNAHYVDSEKEQETLNRMHELILIMKEDDESAHDLEKVKNEFFDLLRDNYYKLWD